MVSDAFALPRDVRTAIHLSVGSWEYRTIVPELELPYRGLGWEIVLPLCDGSGLLIVKYTHSARCGCGREANHALCSADN